MQQQTKKRKALQESLLRVDSNPANDALRGNYCPACKLTFFPSRVNCAKCCALLTKEAILPSTGKVASFTTIHRKPPNSVIEAPYTVGEIDIGKGINVISIIRADPKEIKIGMKVELLFEKLREDSEGNDLVVYAYKPAKKQP